MGGRRTTGMLIVDGMSCAHCEQLIESALRALEGVLKVRATAPLSEVRVSYDPGKVSFEAIADAVRGAGYSIRGDKTAPRQAAVDQESAAVPVCAAAPPQLVAQKSRATSLYRFLGLIAVIAAVYFVLRSTVGFTFLPSVSQSMGYGLLFVVGLFPVRDGNAPWLREGGGRHGERGSQGDCPGGLGIHPGAGRLLLFEMSRGPHGQRICSLPYSRERSHTVATQTMNLNVEGMSCQHCVRAVKGAVGALPGVDAVEVSLERKLVTVGYDPALTSLPAITTAIEDQGYSVK